MREANIDTIKSMIHEVTNRDLRWQDRNSANILRLVLELAAERNLKVNRRLTRGLVAYYR